jgi:hypothetical protein
LPHAEVIDESLEGIAMLLERVRLHVKGGMQRLKRGEEADAVAALYDAISSAMQRYTYPELANWIIVEDVDADLSDDHTLFQVLRKSGIINDAVLESDFSYIEETLDDALEDRLSDFDKEKFLDITNRLLTQLMNGF